MYWDLLWGPRCLETTHYWSFLKCLVDFNYVREHGKILMPETKEGPHFKTSSSKAREILSQLPGMLRHVRRRTFVVLQAPETSSYALGPGTGTIFGVFILTLSPKPETEWGRGRLTRGKGYQHVLGPEKHQHHPCWSLLVRGVGSVLLPSQYG